MVTNDDLALTYVGSSPRSADSTSFQFLMWYVKWILGKLEQLHGQIYSNYFGIFPELFFGAVYTELYD